MVLEPQPALLIVYVRGLTPQNMPLMKAYSEAVAPYFEKRGAWLLSRGAIAASLEGAWPWQALAVFAWPSTQAAMAAWTSPDYGPIRALRERDGGIEFQAILTEPFRPTSRLSL